MFYENPSPFFNHKFRHFNKFQLYKDERTVHKWIKSYVIGFRITSIKYILLTSTHYIYKELLLGSLLVLSLVGLF